MTVHYESSAAPTGTDSSALRDLFVPHVNSFNALVEPGGFLDAAVSTLPSVFIDENIVKGQPRLRFWIESASIGQPIKPDDSVDTRLMPNECRELGLSYSAPLMVTINRQVGANGPVESTVKRMGLVPIMLRSDRCHLAHASPDDLISAHEESVEQGGTFIVNGNDRIVRLLIVPRRHYVTCVIRQSFTNRGSDYSPFACQLRCVRPDQSSKTLTFHYLNTGSATLRFSLRKQEFFLPVMIVLKALIDCSDQEIYDRLVAGESQNAWLTDRIELMIRAQHSQRGLQSRRAVLAYLGSHFRQLLRLEPSVSDEQAGKILLSDHLFVHCVGASEETVNKQKFDCLIHSLHKLYSLVQGKIKQDNPDALHCQEVMLPGHLYGMILKEKLEELLWGIRASVATDLRLHPAKISWSSDKYFRSILESQKDIGRAMQYFIVTGNLVSPSGLDLMQVSGFTIVAERLNYLRYLAHFRAIHRGQFFTTMKTTDVRKLMPESFGFLCGVHTPDGAPCGLLNHLTHHATILTHAQINSQHQTRTLIQTMTTLGLLPTSLYPTLPVSNFLPVIVDGIVIGKVQQNSAQKFIRDLRAMKISDKGGIPKFTEIYAILDFQDKLFPAISVYTTPGRVIRPVTYLGQDKESNIIEWIGSQEQITLEIAITELDFRPKETTHQEIAPTSMFSLVASLTPFSDFNQSPRNMYQCQMGKQTMGSPFHSNLHRIDNKVFRIQNPQSPLVRNENYVKYGIDEYPLGTNAVVAVLAYTGYDMEDAMIINQAAYNRGFKHGSVYKYKEIDLSEKRKRGETIHHHFSNLLPASSIANMRGERGLVQRDQNSLKSGPNGESLKDPNLDIDGLPSIGQLIEPGQAVYSVYDDVTKNVKVFPHKENESCYIDDIRLLGSSGDDELQKVGIKLRFNRNPVIGDKFASRAGQKGVMSTLFGAENMPFTESGMTPDIIINPHAFPSRMTIGMLIESMAGKSGALHGKKQNSTPFQFSENHRAVDYFGSELLASGYNYVGSEPMYSGITGEECRADIFIGLVYYQRLRHMVSDKAQVRATGPVNAITKQPIKGRKVHGGIRFGEMERDSLLGHGTAFLLHDRLMNCSDYHTGLVCTHCGSILSPGPINNQTLKSSSINLNPFSSSSSQSTILCRTCNTGDGCTTIAVPYVFLYLANELAAMGIKLTLKVA